MASSSEAADATDGGKYRLSATRLCRLPWSDGVFLFAEQFWSRNEADVLLARLRDELDWRQHHVRLFGKERPAPRLSAWYGDKGVAYTYSGIRHQAVPWLPVLEQVRDRIQAGLAGLDPGRFNGVLGNRYREGADGMGWHSDDESELGPAPVIASASFGAPRRFVLRHRASGHREQLQLGHGSLLIMAGTSQRCWQHAVPKTRRPCGERINLTLRRIAS